MPALPVIANAIRCSVQGTLANGRQWVNVHHVLKPSASSVSAAIAAIDPLLLALYTVDHSGGGAAVLGYSSSDTKLVSIAYLPLDGTSATTSINHPFGGVAAGDSLPANAPLVVTHQTGLRGRDKRGRSFLPPMVESVNGAQGYPGPVQVAALQVNFNGYLSGMTAATMLPIVASYRHGAYAIIVDYLVRQKWASRRKRQGRQP